MTVPWLDSNLLLGLLTQSFQPKHLRMPTQFTCLGTVICFVFPFDTETVSRVQFNAIYCSKIRTLAKKYP